MRRGMVEGPHVATLIDVRAGAGAGDAAAVPTPAPGHVNCDILRC
jgi:hypothetical protein